MNEKVWARGIFWNAPKETQPKWVVGSIGIHRDNLIQWLQEQPVSEKGYLYLDVAEKRGTPGEYNVALNTFQPKQRAPEQRAPQVKAASGDFDDDPPF
jgi:hypothetical protein